MLTGKDAEADKIGGIPPHFMPEAWGGPKGYATLRPVLLSDRVRCVGDRVAFVVAETEAQARDAAELVGSNTIRCRQWSTSKTRSSHRPPKIWEDCAERQYRRHHRFRRQGATDAAFGKAKHVVKAATAQQSRHRERDRATGGDRRLRRRQRQLHALHHVAGSARREDQARDGGLQRSGNENPRVSPDVGGGFGMKANIYPDDVLVLWASRRCGRPVKWTATRGESLLHDTHARDQVIYGEIALDETARFSPCAPRAYQALGAYWWAAITAPLFFSLMLIPSVYDIQTIDLSTSAVFTNTAPTSVYRGAGRPEAIYFIERMLDEAARVSGIDRVELRRRNLIKPEAMPYHTPTHHNYDSGEFERLMDQCLELADWDGFEARRKDPARKPANCAAAR